MKQTQRCFSMLQCSVLQTLFQHVLDAKDKDVYVIASKVSQEILAPLLIHRKGKYYDGSQLCPHEIRQYTTQIYVISSYDTVSGFYDHGKKTIVKKLWHPQLFVVNCGNWDRRFLLMRIIFQRLKNLYYMLKPGQSQVLE